MSDMKTKERLISVTEFKAKCLKILDDLDSQGVVINKRVRPVAKLTLFHAVDNSKLIGSMKAKVIIKGNIFSTGRKWNAQL